MTRLCCGLLFASLAGSAFAEGLLLSIKLENDLFSAGSDRHYTIGTEGTWTFEPDQGLGRAVSLTLFRAGHPAACSVWPTVSGSNELEGQDCLWKLVLIILSCASTTGGNGLYLPEHAA